MNINKKCPLTVISGNNNKPPLKNSRKIIIRAWYRLGRNKPDFYKYVAYLRLNYNTYIPCEMTSFIITAAYILTYILFVVN